MLLPVRSAKTCGGSHNTQLSPCHTPCHWYHVAGPEAGGLLALDAASAWRGRQRTGHTGTQRAAPQTSATPPMACVDTEILVQICVDTEIDTCVQICRYFACDGSETALYTDKHHAAAHDLYRDLARMLRITISPVPSVLKIHSSNNLFCSKQLAASLHSSPLQFQRRALVIMVTIYLMIQIYLFNHSRTHVSRKYTRIFRGDTGLLTILNFVETKIGSVPLTSKLLWQKILFVIFEGKFYPHPPQKFILLLIF